MIDISKQKFTITVYKMRLNGTYAPIASVKDYVPNNVHASDVAELTAYVSKICGQKLSGDYLLYIGDDKVSRIWRVKV